ncbi:hypothetical protein M7I_2022 [Glarea lozoyensis 74030]|nr:hypothetical protein M7I_2022 [Glarea lozoyensis 74030]
MPPKAKAAKPAKKRETIPLICTLCPKHPTFSDTSHLLTHISSKSHLAARFKLQIRSQSEQEARDTLDDFDAWYRNNNLDVLLSDRLAVKEQKKAAKDRKNDENRGLVPIKRAPAKKKELAKKEEELEDDSSVLQKTPAYRAPVPRMALWETHRDGERVGTPTREGWQSASIFETPTAASRVLDDDKSETVVDEGSMLDPR